MYERTVRSILLLGISPKKPSFLRYFSRSYLRRNDFYVEDENEFDESNKNELHWTDVEAQQQLNEYLKNPENVLNYKKILAELDFLRDNDSKIPREIRPRDWPELLEAKTFKKRKYFLKYLYRSEQMRHECMLEKENKQDAYLQYVCNKTSDSNEPRNNVHNYSITGNSLFLRIYPRTIANFYNGRLINAMLFGNKIVLDFDYDDYMNIYESRCCAKQLLYSFSNNRMHEMPFDFHLCNAEKSGPLMKKMFSYIPTLYDDDFPINIHKESYLDVFDKKKLVYLTPSSGSAIEKFDPEMIYIIGAYYERDQGKCKPASLEKLKREGIKIAKLPLSQYLTWGVASKDLPIDTMINILLHVQRSNDWNFAFRHISKKKLQHEYVIKLQKIVQRESLKKMESENYFQSLEHKNPIPESMLEPEQVDEKTGKKENYGDSDFSHTARARRKKW